MSNSRPHKHHMLNHQIESNAHNAMHGEVNPNTGQLKISISPPKLPIASGVNVNLSISYTQNYIATGKTVLGFPEGWSFNLSYIIGGRIYINGQQSYLIDSDAPSGMRYYRLKNATLVNAGSTPFPYDSAQQYVWKLSMLGGDTQYFDANGRLLGVADKNGNCILYYYNEVEKDVRDSTLQKVVTRVAGSGYQQQIDFAYSGDASNGQVNVRYPSGGSNTIAYQFSFQNGKMIRYQDPLGDATVVTYQGGVVKSDLVSAIAYPSGLAVTYQYSEIMIMVPGGAEPVSEPQDVVSAVKRISYTDGGPQTRVTTYNYDPLGDKHNYTGYPKYVASTSVDSLMQSNDNAYMYHTQIDDGITVTDHQYNRLHLELKVVSKTKQGNQLISETVNQYQDEGGDNYFPPYVNLSPNYQTPVVVNKTEYNDAGQSRMHQVKTAFNDYAQITAIDEFESQAGTDPLQLVKHTATVYDASYGLVLQKDVSDYKPKGVVAKEPVVTRHQNTLNSDQKFVASSELGFVVNDIYQPDTKKTYQYDDAGRMVEEVLAWVDPSSHPGPDQTTLLKKYDYDASRHILTISETNAVGDTTQNVIDTTTGFLLRVINPLGKSLTKTYDDLGRVVSTTNVLGATSKLSYTNGSGKALNKVTAVHPNGYQTFSYINGFGEQERQSDNMASNGERVLWLKVYNALGQLVSTQGVIGQPSLITYQYTDRGRLLSKTDALGNVDTFCYDEATLSSTKRFNEIETAFAQYNDQKQVTQGQVFSSEGKDFIINHSLFDAKGLKVRSVVGDASDQSAHWVSHDVQYDASGHSTSATQTGWDGVVRLETLTRNLLSQTTQTAATVTQSGQNSEAESTLLMHNALGQLVEAVSPLKEVERFTYDAIGNVHTRQDYANKTFTTSYDFDQATITESYLDTEGNPCEIVRQLYVDTGKVKSIEQFKNRASVGKMQLQYTLDGLLETMTYPDGKTVNCRYDQCSRLASFEDVLGHVTLYSYDAHGRVNSVSVDQSHAVTMTYWDKSDNQACSGQLKTVTHVNGLQTSYTYSGYNRVHSMAVMDPSQGDKQLSLVTYDYEATTQAVSSIQYQSDVSKDLGANCTKQFQYNSLGQLVSESILDVQQTKVSQTGFTYDAAGNITSKTVQANGETKAIQYTYDAGNKLTNIAYPDHQVTLRYDANGNITDDGMGNTYEYDVLNQLTAHTDAKGVRTVYTYYPNGLRATKQPAKQSVVQFYYDLQANIINEVQDKASAYYLMTDSTRYVRFYIADAGVAPEVECFVQDVRDIHAIVSGDKQLETVYEYEAYGLTIGEEAESTFSLQNNPFKYTQAYQDIESGLYYLIARYYDPQLMCFISQDSSILFNRYSYADGNPISLTDPSGHMAKWVSDLLGALTIAMSIVAIVAGSMLVATGVGAPIGVPLITSGVLGVGSGATSIAAANTSGHLSEDLSYASMGLGIGSAVAGGVAGASGLSGATGAAVASTGAEVTASQATINAYRAMIVSSVFGAGSGAVGIAAEAEHNKTLGYVSIGLGGAAFVSGLVSAGYGFSETDNPNARGFFDEKGEVYYRTMSIAHADQFQRTGVIPATGETFLSPTRGFSDDYVGVMLRFRVRLGTTDALEAIGVRNQAGVFDQDHPLYDLPQSQKGWGRNPGQACFKAEGTNINVGLGRGLARTTFSDRIIASQVVRA